MKRIRLTDKVMFNTIRDALDYIEKHPRDDGWTVYVYPSNKKMGKRAYDYTERNCGIPKADEYTEKTWDSM